MADNLELPSEWLRGVIEVCVLRVIADGPTYGYAIVGTLERSGLGTLKGGTLYPLLGRLEAAGWVNATWREGDGGPGRKFYELTSAGQIVLDSRRQQWIGFAATVSDLLGTEQNVERDA
ncbi:MAG: PadR family transcriptional regulator [Propionibacteriaceae bacterium]|jgi:PadR family transcriptional regulator PadR|nr:PadR family transcriptional regulator [Propionibacteriaceae bacterium]